MGTRVDRAGGLVALACLALSVVGCSGGPAASPAGQAQTPGVPPTSVTATVKPTTAPTASPLPMLDLLWESAGVPAASGRAPDTYSPAIDPLTGDVWVAVSFDSIIWIFGKDGTFKNTFGHYGKGDGEFSFVRPTCTPCGAGAMAFAKDGTLFVADVGNQRIQKFDPKHKFVKAWGSFGAGDGQFADANQIATDGTFVYVSDDARGDLQVFKTDGTFVRKIVGGEGWLAVDPSGTLYVSNRAGVSKYSAGAVSVVATYKLPDFPRASLIGLAADGAGHLYYDAQADDRPYVTLALGEFDLATGKVRLWANGGETIVVTADGTGIYEANFVTSAWPKATLRKYAIPKP